MHAASGARSSIAMMALAFIAAAVARMELAAMPDRRRVLLVVIVAGHRRSAKGIGSGYTLFVLTGDRAGGGRQARSGLGRLPMRIRVIEGKTRRNLI